MKYYIELSLLPDPTNDINLYFIWQKLYQQLHLAFVEVKNDKDKINIGVSFPEYKEKQGGLGKKCRLFAQDKQALEVLNLNQWLDRLDDYIHIKKIKAIDPKKVKGYAVFRRIHEKASIEKLAYRRAERLTKKGIKTSYQQALDFFMQEERPQSQQEIEKLPYINMKSLSSQHQHALFINYEKVKKPTMLSLFSTYGLSSAKEQSSVPLF